MEAFPYLQGIVIHTFLNQYTFILDTLRDLHYKVANFRLLVFGDSVVLLFAPEDTIKGCGDPFVPGDVGVILSSEGVAPLFESSSSGSSNIFKLPAAAVLATFDW